MHPGPTRAQLIAKTAIVAFLAAAATFAHFYTNLVGINYRGPLLLLDHLFDISATLFLIACFTAVGRRALRVSALKIDDPIQELVFSTALGSGLVASAILGLGFLPGPLSIDVAVLLLACVVFARRELLDVPTLARRAARQLVQSASVSRVGLVALVALGAAVLFLVLFALAPPADWDSLMYHLDIPAEFVSRGRIFVPQDNLHVAHIGLAHLLYVPLLAAGCSNGPALLSAVMAILLAAATFSLAEHSFGKVTAGLSLLLFWGTTTILLVAPTPKVDVTVAFFLLTSHYVLLASRESKTPDKHMILAAVLLGFAFAIKYNAVLYGIGLAPFVVLGAQRRAGSLRASYRPIILFGLAAICAAVPWLVKNWGLLGAPLYPLLSEPILQPWLIELLTSDSIPESVDPRIFGLWWEARVPFNLWDAFFHPERITIEAEGSAYYTNPALLLLPFAVLLWKHKKLAGLVAPPIAYLLLLLIPFPLTNLRYLLPAIAPLTIAVAYVLWRVSEVVPRPRARQIALAALATIALVPSGRSVYRRLAETAALEHAVGLASPRDYLSTHPLPEVRVHAVVSRFVNTEIPSGSRVLMLFETRGFYMEREVLQDNIATNWPILAAALGPDDCLERANITHVLVAVATLRYMIAGGVDPAYFHWDRFLEFADRCLQPIWEGPGVVVYRHIGGANPVLE